MPNSQLCTGYSNPYLEEYPMQKQLLLRRLACVLQLAGAALIVGSATAFIAMNLGARAQNGEFFYWQRYFVDNVVVIATRPGVWLLFAGTALRLFCHRGKKLLILSLLALAVALNSECFIIPLSHKTSALAFKSAGTGVASSAFIAAKGLEDRLGAVNGLLLLSYLTLLLGWRTDKRA